METGSNYENAIKLTLVSRKFVRISKNESWDAHLDHMGFPKMYESSLCGDRCNAMDPSRWGQTDRPKSSTLYPAASRGIIWILETKITVVEPATLYR